MDFIFFHPNTLPLAKRIMGGDDVPRLIGACSLCTASSAVRLVRSQMQHCPSVFLG